MSLSSFDMEAMNAEFECSPLPGVLDDLGDLLLGLAHDLLDARGVNAPIGDELSRERGERSRGALDRTLRR